MTSNIERKDVQGVSGFDVVKQAVATFTSSGSTGVSYISLIGMVMSTVGDGEFKVLLGLQSIWEKSSKELHREVESCLELQIKE